ncbi:hypothetical protein FDP41_005942 [Naegleria fowleri]|uniref:Exonuclease domain-containing protein n=1 Tax=Naegleria fowleri TaxID=5763 RepID=A0A6A5BQE6_NAEFO|nr:uncharacterized protein FDP41_005942 [Naegleria fowleri]KAF0975189.1 hypothetical protein FDP41_005942 [Naegleria fowleri]
MEMTGLDIEQDHILEIAVIITDGQLNTISEMDSLVIHQEDSVLNSMNDWCKEHHGQSGLTQRVRESQQSVQQVEELVLEFVKKYVDKPRWAPLGGNSVYMDRLFMKKEMKKLDEYLHYRIIDVSTIKELARRWAPQVFDKVVKKNSHRALDDIKESIEELKLYRKHLFHLE